MLMIVQSFHKTYERIVPVLGCLLLLTFLSSLGCSEDEPEVLEIYLNPASLDFDPDDNLYFVDERYAVFWKLDNATADNARIRGPVGGRFTPWGLDVGKESGSEVLFVSAATDTSQLLLVLSTDIQGSTLLEETDILAQTEEGASDLDPLTEVRGVASLYVAGDGYRVFVCDGNLVRVFKYDPANPTVLAYLHNLESPGTGECSSTFKKPFGVATDPDTAVLYVIDRDEDALYRFVNVDSGTPTCEKQVKTWTAIGSQEGDPWFSSPEGVGFLAGQATAQEELIAVADSGQDRVVTFYWDGSDFVPTDVPANFNPYDDASPFDLAFDHSTGSLWVTYPDAHAIGIPTL